MKFRSHAELEIASWEDLAIATEQGGILDIDIGGIVYGTKKMTYEEQQYKEKLRKAKEAQEEAEYQKLVASVPSVVPMLTFGVASLAVGAFIFASTLFWVLYRRRRSTVANEQLAGGNKSLSETLPAEPKENEQGVLA